jgi:hypothetical protein
MDKIPHGEPQLVGAHLFALEVIIYGIEVGLVRILEDFIRPLQKVIFTTRHNQ